MNQKEYTVKRTMIKAVLTRLKPNQIEVETNQKIWDQAEHALNKLTIDDLSALETLVHGHRPDVSIGTCI